MASATAYPAGTELARVVASVASVAALSQSRSGALVLIFTLIAIEVAFALWFRPRQSNEAKNGGGDQVRMESAARMRLISLRFIDEKLERDFGAQRFRDTEATVFAFCAVQIPLLFTIGLLPGNTAGLGEAAPYLMVPLAAVAATRLGVRRIGDAARAQHLLHWAWFAIVLTSCLLAIDRQTRAPREEEAPTAASAAASPTLGMAGVGVAAVLVAGTATYLRLFVIDVAPRLCILCCLMASDVVLVLAGTPLSALQPAYAEPALAAGALVVGDAFGLMLEYQQRLAFLAIHDIVPDITHEAQRSQPAFSKPLNGARSPMLCESPSTGTSFSNSFAQPAPMASSVAHAHLRDVDANSAHALNDSRGSLNAGSTLCNFQEQLDESGSETPIRLRRSAPSSLGGSLSGSLRSSMVRDDTDIHGVRSSSFPAASVLETAFNACVDSPSSPFSRSVPDAQTTHFGAFDSTGRVRRRAPSSLPSSSFDGGLEVERQSSPSVSSALATSHESVRNGGIRRQDPPQDGVKDHWWQEQPRAAETGLLHRAAARAAAERDQMLRQGDQKYESNNDGSS